MTGVRCRRACEAPAAAARATAAAEAMSECARRTLHRVSLAVTVTQASPILLDAVAKTGVDVADLLDRLRDPATRWLADPSAHGQSLRHRYNARIMGRLPWQRRDAAAPFGPDADVGLHMVRHGPQLGVCDSFGRLRVSTAGASAWLWIDDALPETLRDALPGMPVQALVSHPLLDGRDYLVLRAEPDTAMPYGTVLHVRTGLRRWRTPWSAAEAVECGAEAMAALIGGIGT